MSICKLFTVFLSTLAAIPATAVGGNPTGTLLRDASSSNLYLRRGERRAGRKPCSTISTLQPAGHSLSVNSSGILRVTFSV